MPYIVIEPADDGHFRVYDDCVSEGYASNCVIIMDDVEDARETAGIVSSFLGLAVLDRTVTVQ